jgi:hypothetical protein
VARCRCSSGLDCELLPTSNRRVSDFLIDTICAGRVDSWRKIACVTSLCRFVYRTVPARYSNPANAWRSCQRAFEKAIAEVASRPGNTVARLLIAAKPQKLLTSPGVVEMMSC